MRILADMDTSIFTPFGPCSSVSKPQLRLDTIEWSTAQVGVHVQPRGAPITTGSRIDACLVVGAWSTVNFDQELGAAVWLKSSRIVVEVGRAEVGVVLPVDRLRGTTGVDGAVVRVVGDGVELAFRGDNELLLVVDGVIAVRQMAGRVRKTVLRGYSVDTVGSWTQLEVARVTDWRI